MKVNLLNMKCNSEELYSGHSDVVRDGHTEVIIVSPSLDASKNVSGISSVTQFVIGNNKECDYVHFELGRKDNERGGLFRVFSLLRCFLLWKRMLRHHPNALVHYNFPLSKASIIRDPLFMREAKRKGRKMVVHIHGGVFLTHYDEAPSIIKRILRNVFAWNVPFVVLGKGEKQIVEQTFGAKKVYSLPNCVDLRDAEKFKREYNKTRPLVIGYIGRLAETKGMNYLLGACCELKQQGIPFVLKLAGAEEFPGCCLPRFTSSLGEQFVYSGIVSGEGKTEFLKSLDVFVLPSFFEGLPMSLLECMSFGAVPVTTAVGSIPDVVEDEKDGLYIKVKDVKSIVVALERLHNNRNLLEVLGQKARERIFRQFNPKVYVETLNEIYNTI